MTMKLRFGILVYCLATVFFTAFVISAFQDNSRSQISPSNRLSPAYCSSVGDDNCDGTIMSFESGGECIPPNGGPMLCKVKEVK